MKKVRLENEYTNEAFAIIGCTEATFKKMVFKIQPDYKGWGEDCEGVAARTENPTRKGYTYYLMWLPKGTDAATVVHECIHVKNFIFLHCGVKPDPDNDEHEAYFVSYLFFQVWEAMRRKR